MLERTKQSDAGAENDENTKDGSQQIVDFGSALTKTPHGSVYCLTIIGQIEATTPPPAAPRPRNMSTCCHCLPSWRRATRWTASSSC